MLGHLIRKEILDQVLSLRFLLLSIVGAVVIWLSLFSGYTYYQARLGEYRSAQTATEKRIRNVLSGEFSGGVGYFIHKRPTPMSIFTRGLEPVLGRSGTNGEAEKTARLKWSPAEMEPILGIFLPLDLGLVVRIVLSMFVLLFTYDAVCGEKEMGTLRLMGSFPMPRSYLLAGKFIGVLIPTFTAFGLPLLLGIAAMLLAPEVQFTDLELARLGMMLVLFGLYLIAFICAGLLASCLTHRAATAFVLLLAFWVGIGVVLPRLSLMVADQIRPNPSFYELQAEKEGIFKLMWGEARKLRYRWQEDYTASTGRDVLNHPEKPEDLAAYRIYQDRVNREKNALRNVQWDRLDEAYRNRYRARLDLAVALARFSPAFALRNAAVQLAGTGMDRHRRFFTAYKQHKKVFRDEWGPGLQARLNLKNAHPAKYGPFEWEVSDMPRFMYRETRTEMVGLALVDMGVLALWGLLTFLGAYVALLRYDLR